MKYISILRGINVSGQKKIKMGDLKLLYESLGFQNVVTYIQSGNVIFDATVKNTAKLKATIEEAIEETLAQILQGAKHRVKVHEKYADDYPLYQKYLAAARTRLDNIEDELTRIKKEIEDFYPGWRKNYDWWQANYPKTRVCHRQTVCDAYEDVGGNRESLARKMVREAS